MASVLDLLHPIAQPSLNGFDLSSKHVYGSGVGRMDSPLQLETVPHDKFKINLGALMRTMTPDTAPFLRGKVTFDFYFVPYTQLWHPFNQFINQRLDVHSSIQKGTSRVPVIHLYDLFKLIGLVYSQTPKDPALAVPYYLKDIHNVPWYNNIWNMLDFFGYGNYLNLKSLLETENYGDEYLAAIERYKNKYVNVFRPAAYQHVWYDYYRNKFYDNYDINDYNPNVNDYVLSFNFDDISCVDFANSIIPIDTTDVSASVNMRVYMLFTQRYCQFKQDLIQSALPSQQFGAVSDVQVDLTNLAIGVSQPVIDSAVYPSVENYSSTSVGIVGGSVASSDVFVPTQSSYLSGLGNNSEDDDLSIQLRTPHSHNIHVSTSPNSYGSFDVIALKRAEALQKWRQNALRAGNMVDDAFRSHFGVTPRYEADNNALKLGSFEGSINVNTVETTAQSTVSGNNKVGNLGSSVLATISGKEINFHCSDFGVIVCMSFFRPESEYSSVMIDRANILNEPFDFFSVEFCNTGLDAITLADFNAQIGDAASMTVPLGFASQYWWYKEALDKCHGQFAKFDYTPDVLTERFKGDSVMWCAPRLLDLTQGRGGSVYRNKSSLYVNPSLLDDVFGVLYHNRFGNDMSYYECVNQLIYNVYFDIKAIRPMTRVGLPQF